MTRILLYGLILGSCLPTAHCQANPRTNAATTPRAPRGDSSTMARIFKEDQKPRQDDLPPEEFKKKWGDINKADAERREQVLALLKSGDLSTGNDFQWAALIFQHGSSPNDYLLAHTLATIAVAKGKPNAIWVASATLDRYLESVGQPQIFGTQYQRKVGTTWTQEPYNRTLISDALRSALGVPSQAAQDKQLQEYNAHTPQ